jgi:opacity protein-like surface antigen
MKLTLLITVLCGMAANAFGQKHELGFTFGRLIENDRSILRANSGSAFQVNYGYRFWGNSGVAVSGEIHMLASPQRLVTPGPSIFLPTTRDFASLYLTPGIRCKFNPQGRVQPYATAGGGYALYEQSTTTTEGTPNPAPRHIGRGAFMFGGGMDIKVWNWLALRGEVRDFYTGNPAYNRLVPGSGQHNVVAGGGFVFRFGQ